MKAEDWNNRKNERREPTMMMNLQLFTNVETAKFKVLETIYQRERS